MDFIHKQTRCLEQNSRNKRKQIQTSKETHREYTGTEGRVTSIGHENHCFIGRNLWEGRIASVLAKIPAEYLVNISLHWYCQQIHLRRFYKLAWMSSLVLSYDCCHPPPPPSTNSGFMLTQCYGNWIMNWKGCGRKRPWQYLSFWGYLRKSNQISRCPRWDLNLHPLEHKWLASIW
jgi:hypothetical protein